MNLLYRVIKDRFSIGSMSFVDHRGNTTSFGDDGPPVVVKFNKPGTLLRVLRNPMLRLGECYMNGELEIQQGTLTDFLRLLRLNLSDYAQLKSSSLISKLAALMQSWNGVVASRRNVAFHYNLEDSLYAGFLDEDMHYSCAYFENPGSTLEEAQQAKCRHLLAKLHLAAGQSVLDIGSGWGSLAMYLAANADVHVTGITLSSSQLNVAKRRANQRKLTNQVRFLLDDYREHIGSYDAVVSVGMFEHVGKKNFNTYFDQVRNFLKPNGVAVIHTIGSSKQPMPTNPWIKKYIFPGGYIPSLSEIATAIEKSGLCTSDIEVWRLHYARTLEEWNARFQLMRDQVRELKGERFCRLWEFYLCACQTAFEHDSLVVFQTQLAHRNDTVPLTRNYLYA